MQDVTQSRVVIPISQEGLRRIDNCVAQLAAHSSVTNEPQHSPLTSTSINLSSAKGRTLGRGKRIVYQSERRLQQPAIKRSISLQLGWNWRRRAAWRRFDMTYVFLVTFLKSKNNNLGELLKDLCLRSVSDMHFPLSRTQYITSQDKVYFLVSTFFTTQCQNILLWSMWHSCYRSKLRRELSVLEGCKFSTTFLDTSQMTFLELFKFYTEKKCNKTTK